MKRDMNLVREILLWAVAQEDAGVYGNPQLPDYTEDQIAHHVHLMAEAGLVVGTDISAMDSAGPSAMLMSVTWAGHDFIDAARDNDTWRKVFGKVISSRASFTFDLLKQLLTQAAKETLGL